MTITYTSHLITGNGGGNTGTSSNITTDPNSRALLFFIYMDASNTVANNIDPTTVSWNGINATQIAKIPNSVSPLGQMQCIYLINNPPVATAQASVMHSAQYHHHYVVKISADLPVSINCGLFSFNTDTAASSSVVAAVGDTVFHSVVADGRTLAEIVLNGSSSLVISDGGSSRQAIKLFAKQSTGGTETESYTLSAASRWSAISVSVTEGVYSIDEINGDPTDPVINIGTPNTVTKQGLSTLVSGNVGTVGAGNTSNITWNPNGSFNVVWPPLDLQPFPSLGTVNFTAGDGVRSRTIVGNLALPSGYTDVTFNKAVSGDNQYLGFYYPLTNKKCYYNSHYDGVNGNKLVINSEGKIEVHTSILPLITTLFIHNSQSPFTIEHVQLKINVVGNITVNLTGLLKQSESPFIDGTYANIDRP